MSYDQLRSYTALMDKRLTWRYIRAQHLEQYDLYVKSAPPVFSTQTKLNAQRVPEHCFGSLFKAVEMLDLIKETIKNPDQPLIVLAWHLLIRELGLHSVSELGDSRIPMERVRVSACVAKTDEPLSQGRDHRPHAYISRQTKISDIPLIFDTGASYSITANKSDFVSEIIPITEGTMQGIGNLIEIKGKGWVEWDIIDQHNVIARVRTQAYYIPEASDVRLFSPQTYFQENGMSGRDCCWLDAHQINFKTAQDVELSFPFDSRNNIPYMLATEDANVAGLTAKQVLSFSRMSDVEIRGACRKILDDNNHNLTASEKELSLWHQRLCHIGPGWVQELMKNTVASTGDRDDPIIPTKTKAANCPRPQCASCHMAKQHVRTPKSVTTHVNQEKEGAIRRAVPATESDDTFSMDQIVCKLPGRLPNTFGKERTTDQYHGATLYMSHSSSWLFLVNQISLNAGETLQGKRRLDRIAAEYGRKIKHFHTDNHPFGSKEFQEDLALNDQTVTFSGVGAHHQNGISENAVKLVTNMARSMMMHQLIHWPDEFDPSLWGFALQHAVHIWNHTPNTSTGLSPWEKFTGVKDPTYSTIRRARVWGCPVYVLDPTLQDGKKLPKWKKRSRLGMNIGVSDQHSSSVNQVLSQVYRTCVSSIPCRIR
jgi:hypothetical protein